MFALMDEGSLPADLPHPVEVAAYAAYERVQRDWEKLDKKLSNLVQFRDKPQPAQPQKKSAPAPCAAPAPTGQVPRLPNRPAEGTQKPAAPAQQPSAPTQLPIAPTEAAEGTQKPTAPAQLPIAPAQPQTITPAQLPSITPAQLPITPAQLPPITPGADPELLGLCAAHFGAATPIMAADLAQATRRLGPGLTRLITENCLANSPRHWAYLHTAFRHAAEQNLTSEADYKAWALRRTAAVVDRPTPSGNDILRRAIGRPLRLKREE